MSQRPPSPDSPEARAIAALSEEAIPNPVKLVIWDLDETFWAGTLSEGGASPLEHTARMVRTLADRGIVSSICSKNDRAAALARLEEMGVREFFVFPHIDWTPKGQAIAAQLSDMGLRAENALFLDDNPMNLEEAAFFNPGLMCLDVREGVPDLAAHPRLAGKDDRERTRLAQYRALESKRSEQRESGLSNEEFLRQSGIRLRYEYDLEAHWDRVLELLNRTNQLNFTKRRVETPEAEAELRALLAMPGAHAGLVEARDRYGDYGYVGIFVMVLRASGSRLEHFAFSCRTLSMGVEQFVHQGLGRPEITIAGPVANPLDTPGTVDWIEEVADFESGAGTGGAGHLCLVGGCDLLQMAFYCGGTRDEFVNIVRNGHVVRYDDVGFLLTDRAARDLESYRKHFEMWSRAEMLALDESVSRADLVFLSLYQSAAGQHFFTFGGEGFGGTHLVHTPAQALRAVMKSDRAIWFAKTFYHRPYTLEERIELIHRAYRRMLDLARPEARVVLMDAQERGVDNPRQLGIRRAFNALNARMEAEDARVVRLPVDEVVAAEDAVDPDHFTRTGYFRIARFVTALQESADPRRRAEG